MPITAFSSGISVSPPELNLTDTGGRFLTGNFRVDNPGPEEQLFTVKADSQESAIAVNPPSFTLKAGKSEPVSVNVDKYQLPGTGLSLKLSVVGVPVRNSGNIIAAGIKLSLAFNTSENSANLRPSADPSPALSRQSKLIFGALALALLTAASLIKKIL